MCRGSLRRDSGTSMIRGGIEQTQEPGKAGIPEVCWHWIRPRPRQTTAMESCIMVTRLL